MTATSTISRRTFHTGVLAGLAAGSTAISASLLRGDEKKSFPKGMYVDVHTHLGQTWNTTVPLTAEELLRWMDAHSVAQSVVLPLSSPMMLYLAP